MSEKKLNSKEATLRHKGMRAAARRRRRRMERSGPKRLTVTSPTLNPELVDRMGPLAKAKGDFWK